MSDSRDSPKRTTSDRLLDSAMHLFARKGLTSTTVGDIELGAGLAPRSGALYKYFKSKDVLLAAGLERHLATIGAIQQELADLPLGEIRPEFTFLGHWLLDELEVERDITHIIERHGEQLGELRERMRVGISDRGYLIGADVVGRWRPDLAQPERERLSVITIGSLINYKRSTWTFGAEPLAISQDDLIETWVDACLAIVDSPSQ